MFEDVAGSIFTTIPLLIGAILFLFAFGVFFAWKQRVGPFYWRDAIPAPIVFNREGERVKAVPNGDKFRKDVEGKSGSKVAYFTSKRFGDRFPAEHLLQMIEYRKAPNVVLGFLSLGSTEIGEFLPLVRKGSGIWSALRFNKVEEDVRAGSDTDDILKARSALAIMREGNKEYIGEDWITKYMPLISAFLMGILLFLSLIVAIQYISAVTGSHLSAMNANTNALITLINQTTNCSQGPPLILPPA